MPANEPLFTGADLGRLFGLANGTQSSMVMRWRDAGQLTVTVVEGPSGAKVGRSIRIAPAAVLAFVRNHPDAYDWRKITDPTLKGVAEQVEKRDPLLPLADAIVDTTITKANMQMLAKKGIPGIVTRFSGAQGTLSRELFIRKSALAQLQATLEEQRQRADPLVALHALIEAEKIRPAPVQVRRDEAPREPLGPGLGALATALGQPVVSDEARRCPQCGARRIVGQALDGWELSCIACGESTPIADPAAEAAREAKRQAEAAQIAAESHRGPGRPPKALAGR